MSENPVDLTAKPLTTISGHEGNIQRIEYLPVGERIVTCSADKTVRIWDVENSEQEGTTMQHEGSVLGLAVTRDGKRILSSGGDNIIRTWDPGDPTAKPLITILGHGDYIRSIAYLPGGTQIVTCSARDMTVRIWDVENGEQEGTSMEHQDILYALAVTRDGKRILSGGEDKRIKVWDSGELVLGPLEGHTDPVNCVRWSLDGSQLFSASDDRTVRCWDSDAGEPIGEPWTGHTDWVNSISLSPDGTKLVSASRDKTVRFWDAHSGDPIDQPLQHDHAPLTTISGHEGAIWNMAYLPRGTRIVTCSWDETVRIWDVENGKQEGTSMKHGDRLFGLAVTRDGKRILSGGDDKRIRVWDAKTHKLIEEWRSHTGWIFCIAISPDDHLAASGDHQAIHVYGVESGELVLGPIKGHEGVVNCVVWSLDGSQLFSASYDCTIRCWDSEDGKAIGEPWMGHTADVGSISLSPDGTKLASASDDKSVRFWDARSGAPNGQPLRHGGPLYAVTFSPSGEFVASGGHNEKVSIWCVPQWDDSQKQVIAAFRYYPTPFLTVFIPAGTEFLLRRVSSANFS
ncbi:hypothetical protein PAXINDRAFT_80999 [Paxillus involutus ATCC 200175]|uniref:WD40 repeat-like protein n=1 Tax=Paxillus involutus ATCC 200175 TaxID=664439 RepID=A0A0C9U1I9_PAXIN|nr:hypothetical protein PAXINDRAFT_80999 [Paxillus involutus ATCC 200175]